MNLALYTLCGLIGIFSFLFIFWPTLIRKNQNISTSPLFRDLQSLQFERLRLLENLQDLETDFKFGKVDEADYQELQSSLLVELAPILERLKKLETEVEKLKK